MSNLLHLTAKLDADCKRNARIRARALELVPLVKGETPSFYYRPEEAIERCVAVGKRNRLFKLAILDLQASDFAMEHWQADYDAAVASLTGTPARRAAA